MMGPMTEPATAAPRAALDHLAMVLRQLGDVTLRFFAQVGLTAAFFVRAVASSVRPPYRPGLVLQQAEFVGVGSLFIVMLTGVFTGAVFTLQSMAALERMGMESMVGAMVLISIARELGPVLTALMVTGRVGSAMATELGTMRVTEQIDAMEVMAVDPVNYLVVPRMIACAVMVPILSLLFLLVAFGGGYVVAVVVMGIDEGSYMARIEWTLDPYDFYQGALKSVVFGVIIAVVGCFKGYHAEGGARGVGQATTQAVVIGSIAIFIIDYVLTSILLLWEPK
jgi:phospholipid/cholesterol/gamma-HCH transport system permease protein